MGPLPWWVYSIPSVLTDGLVASGGPEVGFMFRENSQRIQGAGMGVRLPVPCLPDSLHRSYRAAAATPKTWTLSPTST